MPPLLLWYPTASTSNLVLDALGVTAEFSLDVTKKLRSAYGGSAFRVKRSSDGTEQDIGFSGDNLDSAALLSFCGSSVGTVVVIYDQSGNGRNATPNSNGGHRICDLGVYFGALRVNGTKSGYLITRGSNIAQNTAWAVHVITGNTVAANATCGTFFMFGDSSGSRYVVGTNTSGTSIVHRTIGSNDSISTITWNSTGNRYLIEKPSTSTDLANVTVRKDNGTAYASPTSRTMGAFNSNSALFGWTSAIDTNNANMEFKSAIAIAGTLTSGQRTTLQNY